MWILSGLLVGAAFTALVFGGPVIGAAFFALALVAACFINDIGE
jgi:hypothetical protein